MKTRKSLDCTVLSTRSLLTLILVLIFGCAGTFHDTALPAGVPNLVQFAPGMWRMGQPPDDQAWRDLGIAVGNPIPSNVTIVKLNDEAEGSDDFAEKFMGWQVVRIPLPPEDGKTWTVLVVPSKADVDRAVDAILTAHAAGKTVLWHCSHGRDRTGLVSALVGRRMFGWSKEQGWKDMLAHGFRWELPGLDAFWAEEGSR